jgi:hypothetical protein
MEFARLTQFPLGRTMLLIEPIVYQVLAMIDSRAFDQPEE